MGYPRVLVVDDDAAIRALLEEGLHRSGFEVVTATSVSDALKRIALERFDVLLTDLHMPLAGDGFTVVTAMRHTHPDALTIVLTGYPALNEAMCAIVAEADEILVKPFDVGAIRELILARLAVPRVVNRTKTESVATILEQESEATIQNWLTLVEQNEELASLALSRGDRTRHLPKLVRDLVARLRLDIGTTAPTSVAAGDHGEMRRLQSYTIPMMVEESRILQVSIFGALQRNFRFVDFSHVLQNVVTIADEIDSQLKQSVVRFLAPMLLEPKPLKLVS